MRRFQSREINGAPAKNCSGPEKRDTSILLSKNIANAMIFSIVFEHRDRSRHRHRSIRRRKNDVRFLEENIGRASKKLFGPRKPRCVDFFMQTYSERYDFFDRFRSFSSTAIDRGIGIARFGVEKTSWISLRTHNRIPAIYVPGGQK